jgi:hypothetical protein
VLGHPLNYMGVANQGTILKGPHPLKEGIQCQAVEPFEALW